jgi:hypothetical protein
MVVRVRRSVGARRILTAVRVAAELGSKVAKDDQRPKANAAQAGW